jgi:small conductance mechanosensitive channel
MTLIRLVFLSLFLLAGLPAFAQESGEDDASKATAVTTHPDLSHTHSMEEVQLLVTPLTLEQLQTEADEWQGMIQQTMTQIARLKVTALTAESAEADRIRDEINDVANERSKLIGKYNVILNSMELKGADPEVVEAYRQYITGALASELQATDIKTTMSQAADWVVASDGGVNFLVKAAIIVGAVIFLFLLARIVRSLAERGIRRVGQLSQLMQDFLLKVIFWLTFAVGLMVALSISGVNITPLFAVLGGASFILAFAMQETLGNLAAGLMIMINKPFDVGDLVDTNGIMGKVEAVSIVSTTVRTLDNQVVILPNSAVWGSIITNVTVSPVRRVDMVFGIGYGDDIEATMQVLQKIVESHPKVLDDPEPNIKVHELADSSVNFICRPWVKTEDYWDVHWDLTRQVKEQFDAAGISIPFPQRDVHLYREGS